jgi:hypothetical protein
MGELNEINFNEADVEDIIVRIEEAYENDEITSSHMISSPVSLTSIFRSEIHDTRICKK